MSLPGRKQFCAHRNFVFFRDSVSFFYHSQWRDQNVKYEAIIFDLFGTLVDNISLRQSETVLAAMADILHLPEQTFIATWIIDAWYIRASGEFSSLEATVEHICQMRLPDPVCRFRCDILL
jgi:hypothetical protein